ncbi:hypothetical protein L0F63_006870 [Massospora cicadina]|nr:hypothetical protein L0F63_006870 [Massospora cicadina]
MNGTGELRGTPWRMSEEEYTKYRQVFAGQTNQAYLQANQARDLFAQSGLPTPILFQIWNLADTKRSGQLDVDRFAIAMHLIFQKLAGKAGASSKVPKGEKDDPFKPNAAPVSETEWQVTRERYNAVAEWLPLIGAAQSRFACELKRLDELEAQSSSGEFMGQIAQIDARIKAARVELFSIEDAEQHGYSPATPSNNLLEFDLGTDSISQKAALMLQQRLQALQMKAPIPADAQLRLEAYRRDLESELLANDVAHPTLGELRDLKSRFVEQAALYRAKVHTLQTLNKETEKWFVGKGASTHELRCFLESLSPPKINPATTLPPSATQVDPLAAPAPVASVKPKETFPAGYADETKGSAARAPQETFPTGCADETKDSTAHSTRETPQAASSDPQHEASKAPPPVEQEALHLIAQATRLARAKARSMERSQAAAPVSPKRQPIGSVQKSSQMPSVTVSREEQPLGSSIGDVRAVAPASSNHQPAGSVHGKFQVPCITVSKEERRRQTEQQLGPSIGEIRAAARLARLQALEKLQPKHRSSLKRPPSTPKSAPSPSRALHAPPSAQDEPSNLPQPTNLRASPERANPEDVAGPKLEPRVGTDLKSTGTGLEPETQLNLEAGSECVSNSDSGTSATFVRTEVASNATPNADMTCETKSCVVEADQKGIEEPSSPEPVSASQERGQMDPKELSAQTSLNASPPRPSASSLTSVEMPPQTLREEVASETPLRATVLYEFDGEGISIFPGQTVLVVGEPSEAPGWCLGYVDGSAPDARWIPSGYLDFEKPSPVWFELQDDFSAAVDGGEQPFLAGAAVEILDTSNPDWFLARHPDTQALAYLPANLLVPRAAAGQTNPFALRVPTDGLDTYPSDTETSSQPSQVEPRSPSQHHLPIAAFDFNEGFGTVSSSLRQGWAEHVDPAVLADIPKEEVRRHEAVHELVATEKQYLHDLQLVLDVFYLPLELQGERELLERLFSNLPELIVVNTMFLSHLESASVDEVGGVFLDHAAALLAYATYCGNHAAASRHLQRPSPHLAAFLEAAQELPQCRMLPLAAFLLQPVQRITRYPLLLNQILKHTPADHPDHPALNQAVQRAKSLLDEINASAQASEDAQQLREHARAIDLTASSNFQLEGPTRQLGPRRAIMDGPLAKHRSGRQLHGFLFNDLFILAQPASAGSPYRFVLYRPPMPLAQLQVRDAQTAQGRRGIFSPYDESCFQLLHLKSVLTLKAATPSTTKKWMAEFTKAIRAAAVADGIVPTL